MSQMFQTEVCSCGKLKQFNKLCKACGSIPDAQPDEFYRPERLAVAKALPEEDDIERARR